MTQMNFKTMVVHHTTCVALLLVLATTTTSSYIKYSTVPGYFFQDDIHTNATTFNYTASNFGLVERSYDSNPPTNLTQWQQFALELAHLNTHSSDKHKLLFLGRHGEGHHNTAEAYFGTPAWNCYYSLLDGNATTTWVDAHLTDTGIQQALAANKFWQHQFDVQNMPAPQKYYTSPLYRCLQTAYYTFTNLTLPSNSPFRPVVKELLREGISQHTCDHRSNRTFISRSFPDYVIEDGFEEHDTLWTGVYTETQTGQDARSKEALDEIFTTDDATWISITSHSGEIASLLRVLGHRVFTLNTGAVIPVLVRAETASGSSTTAVTEPSRTKSMHCTGPPATSITGRGCVCWKDVIATPVNTATQTAEGDEL